MDKRFSRYHCSSTPPPKLAAVFAALERAASRAPFSLTKNEIRATASRVHKPINKGKADDVFRFLINHGMILPDADTDRYYLDPQRAQYVKSCCDAHTEPDQAADLQTRLQELKIRPAAKPLAPAPPPPTPQPVSSPPPVAQPIREETMPTEPAPKPVMCFELMRPTQITVQPRFVLFLTPTETDMWESLQLVMREIVEGKRVPIPQDPDALYEAWAPQSLRNRCATQEYWEAYRKFVESGIIQDMGPTSGDRHVHVMNFDPDLYQVIQIEERCHLEIPQTYYQIILAAQNHPPTLPAKGYHSAVMAWAAGVSKEVNPSTVYNKLVGDREGNGYARWGIWVPAKQGLLACVRGFEKYRFVAVEKKPRRHTRKPHSEMEKSDQSPTTARSGSEAKPEAKVEAPAAAEPGTDEIQTREAELRQQIQRLTAELDGLAEQKKQRIALLETRVRAAGKKADRLVEEARAAVEERGRLKRELEAARQAK